MAGVSRQWAGICKFSRCSFRRRDGGSVEGRPVPGRPTAAAVEAVEAVDAELGAVEHPFGALAAIGHPPPLGALDEGRGLGVPAVLGDIFAARVGRDVGGLHGRLQRQDQLDGLARRVAWARGRSALRPDRRPGRSRQDDGVRSFRAAAVSSARIGLTAVRLQQARLRLRDRGGEGRGAGQGRVRPAWRGRSEQQGRGNRGGRLGPGRARAVTPSRRPWSSSMARRTAVMPSSETVGVVWPSE